MPNTATQNNTTTNAIIDTISQQDIIVLGEGPIVAANTIYQASAHANALALHNEISNQNNLNILYPAIVSSVAKMIEEV